MSTLCLRIGSVASATEGDVSPSRGDSWASHPARCRTKWQVFTERFHCLELHLLYKAILEASPWITRDLCQLVAKQPLTGSPKSLSKLPTAVPQAPSCYSFSSVRWFQGQEPAVIPRSRGARAGFKAQKMLGGGGCERIHGGL